MTWMIEAGKPMLLWSYLGPLIAETAFHLGGDSGIGPRVASMLGGAVAATMALGWLLSRKVPQYVALALSLAFLLDPLFTLSQRMARSDSWVIALCLASCWLLRVSLKTRAGTSIHILSAGALAAAASLVWPSAFFLYPLILLELWELLLSEPIAKKKYFYVLKFIAGGVIALVLLVIPIRNNIYILISDMVNMYTLNVDASKSPFEKGYSLFNIDNWLKLIKAFTKTFSPLLPIMALLSLFHRGALRLKLATFLTLILIFATLVYEFRLLYLLPYFVGLAGGIFMDVLKKPKFKASQAVIRYALILTVAWSVFVSLLIRSGYALVEDGQQDRAKITYAAKSFIGEGKHKVFLNYTYEFYFAGRSLGWELYTPYIQYSYDSVGNWVRENEYQPRDKFTILLSKMDYAVFPKGSVSEEMSQQLRKSGLLYESAIVVGNSPSQLKLDSISRSKSILLWFLFGYKSYGPYVMYSRTNNNMTSAQRLKDL